MRRLSLFLAVAMLICFAVLSKFEDRQFLRSLDVAVTVKIQDRIDKSAHLRLAAFVDNTMEGATFFASPEFSSIIILILTVFAIRRNKWRALMIPVAFILLVLIEMYAKIAVHHPSPPFSMIKHTTSVFPADYINEQFSYPSGHAARAVFIAIIGWIVTGAKKRIGIGLTLYVLLVAVSRIYLGHHWFSDVIGGALLGSGLGTILILLL